MSKPNAKSVYIVTGTSSGIGYELALRLLEQNKQVVGISRRRADIDDKNFLQLNGDLTQIAFVEQVFNTLKSNGNINALIFCHGRGKFAALEQFSAQAIESLMAVNFNSVAYMLRRFIPLLKTQGYGDVVAIGSEAALQGARQGSIYCASKFALRGLMQSLRAECANCGLRISMVNPGMVKTSFFDELDFMPGDNDIEHLNAQNVVDAVMSILVMPKNAVVDEINISPLVKVVRKKAALNVNN